MRVACYSPLPPERSGIADYTYELLEELRNHVDLVAVVADNRVESVRAPDGVQLVGIGEADDLRVDCNLYQMGNNPRFHRFFFRRVFDQPGLLIMHDPSLADFMAEMCGGAEGAIFRDEVTYDCPDIGPLDDLPLVDVGNGRKDLDRQRVLFARRIIEANIRTLVHSAAMEHEMRTRYAGADIQTIQLPAPLLPAAEVSARESDEVVFGVFGGINYYKRVRPLVDAFIDTRRRHPKARMVIAGRVDDHDLERQLRSIARSPRLEGSLELKTNLSLAALEAELVACDIGISLRWPTAGEMSATLMRTFGAGRPAIVSDVLQFRELDSRFCWRVTTDFSKEHSALVALMDELAGDRDRCLRAGAAARAFVEREATYRIVAERYVEHLEYCAQVASERSLQRRTFVLGKGSTPGVNIYHLDGRSEMAIAARRAVAALRGVGVDVVEVEMERLPARPKPDSVGDPTRRSVKGDIEADVVDNETHGSRFARARDMERRDDLDAIHRAVAALDPPDALLFTAGPHPIDLYFVENGDADRFGRLARVRRARGRRIVPVLAPGIAPLTLSHRLLLELAERVLVPSAHSADIVKMSTLDSVVTVPFALETGAVANYKATTNERCTFISVVDAQTPVAVANPRGAIEAFRQAFTRAERARSVRLIVVLEGSSQRPDAVEQLSAVADSSGCELIVDPSLGSLARLISRSDVYVSLHRGSGFHLGLAEALAAGKAAVVTGYSGPLDYISDANTCLVGYSVATMEPSDLSLDVGLEEESRRGRIWVKPDVEGAARWMRSLADDRALRLRLGDAASRAVRASLVPGRIGLELRSFLEADPPRVVTSHVTTGEAKRSSHGVGMARAGDGRPL